MTVTTTTEQSLPAANLRAAKKEQAATKRAAATKAVVKPAKAPTTAPAASKRQQSDARKAAALADLAASTAAQVAEAEQKATRKAPAKSDKAKLRWDGDIAKAEGVEVGRQIEQPDGTYWAQVKADGKPEILLKGISGGRAYRVITRFYHYGERPAPKKSQ